MDEKQKYDLRVKLQGYGTQEQIAATIQRRSERNTWENFMEGYEFGTTVDPYSIKNILYPPIDSNRKLGGKRKSRRARQSRKSRHQKKCRKSRRLVK